jgi:hypothetical protein
MLFNSIWRSAIATIAMGLAVAVWVLLLPGVSDWLLGLGGAALGVAVYFALAFLLRSPELRLLRERRLPN